MSSKRNVAETIVGALADLGVTHVWGVVGDALNPVTDAIRRQEGVEWVGVRHEEAGAFAASAQAQLTGRIGVCMGTVGPGSIHLLNGLYDAAKSHAPVLAICGQVPRAEMGSQFFQEVDNDLLFADVARFRFTITSAEQLPRVLEQAITAAYAGPGVAVLTLPGDVGDLPVERSFSATRLRPPAPPVADAELVAEAAALLDAADRVTLLVGAGARAARSEVLELAARLQAPMVLTLKAKEGLEHDNPYEVGQSGLIGNPATQRAFSDCDALLMIGTDFPYPEWLPQDVPTIQVDRVAEHVGRRTSVDIGLVGDAGATVRALLGQVSKKESDAHLRKAREAYETWQAAQRRLVDPAHDSSLLGRVRKHFDNPNERIRPEAVAALLDELADDDAVFTTDTGMSTVWLSRFIRMRGTRRLVGSYNLGSMANAMPQALGAAALDPTRQVISLSGDGGLSMLLGDLMTAVAYELPVKVVVFDNGTLGMVKLEQEQVGLPEFGTTLANPDFAAVARALGLHGVRIEDPADLRAGLTESLAHPGPVLVDVVTNPDEIALPPKPTVDQAWGFTLAKVKETLESRS
jgi:pyruvate dehydrogenase (quinone)